MLLISLFQLLFGILMLYLLQHEFFQAWKMSKKYFTSFWRLTQVTELSLSETPL